MSGGAKFAALLAIVGMACISLCTTAILAWSCCSKNCEQCPVSLYKDSNADLAKKIVSPDTAGSVVDVSILLAVRTLAPVAGRILDTPRSGFVRPMRN